MTCDELYKKVKDIIISYLHVDEDEINPETNLIDDLYIDSIAMVELGFILSETFNVPMINANSKLYVMKDLLNFIYENRKNN